MKRNNIWIPLLAVFLVAITCSKSSAAIIVNADYTSGQGYVNGDLQFQQGWFGQNLTTVDTSGTGTASLAGATGFRRNVNGAGATGGTGGVPSVTGFNANDSLEITFDYQFTLSGNANVDMVKAGIRDEGPNAGNGFDATPQQGFKTQFNVFQASTGGSVKFFPDLNDSANGDALILDGFDLGIDPTDFLSGGVDLVSDRLRINYEASTDGANNWTVSNFSVTNLDTFATFNYGGPSQTFSFAGTDAFVAQQLAPNADAGFLSTTDRVLFEYEMATPNATTILESHFTAAEGYVGDGTGGDDPLPFQSPPSSGTGTWLGQTNAQVDSGGPGTVTSTGGPFDRNTYSAGATGGSSGGGGTLSTAPFNNGDQLKITVQYQFELSGNGNVELASIGFRDGFATTEGRAYGFNAIPQQGWDAGFNVFGPNGGTVKFFPDKADTVNADALIIDGNDLGIDPANSLGNGVDLVSDLLEITYLVETDGAGNWTVIGLDVENVDQATSFSYSGPSQSFTYFQSFAGAVANTPAEDAFYAQQLAINSDNAFSGTIDFAKFEYIAIPEPASMALIAVAGLGLLIRRR